MQRSCYTPMRLANIVVIVVGASLGLTAVSALAQLAVPRPMNSGVHQKDADVQVPGVFDFLFGGSQHGPREPPSSREPPRDDESPPSETRRLAMRAPTGSSASVSAMASIFPSVLQRRAANSARMPVAANANVRLARACSSIATQPSRWIPWSTSMGRPTPRCPMHFAFKRATSLTAHVAAIHGMPTLSPGTRRTQQPSRQLPVRSPPMNGANQPSLAVGVDRPTAIVTA
jgi:hypothetical protein